MRAALPSDYCLLPALKQSLGVHKRKDDCAVEKAMTHLLIMRDTDWYLQWAEKIVLRYSKCVSCDHDCASKGMEQSCNYMSSLLIGNECNTNCMPRKIILLQIFVLRLWTGRILGWIVYETYDKCQQNSGNEYPKR
jgi:hypothetical protein